MIEHTEKGFVDIDQGSFQMLWKAVVVNTLFLFLSSTLELPTEALKLAEEKNFELAGYKFGVREEQLRKPRIVRIGAVQNKIVLPTSAPLANQVTPV